MKFDPKADAAAKRKAAEALLAAADAEEAQAVAPVPTTATTVVPPVTGPAINTTQPSVAETMKKVWQFMKGQGK
jgi:hypothetical protein